MNTLKSHLDRRTLAELCACGFNGAKTEEIVLALDENRKLIRAAVQELSKRHEAASQAAVEASDAIKALKEPW